MLANMAAPLFASEGMVTTEAKAKALRPLAEQLNTKAKKGGLHQKRQVMSVITPRSTATSPR
jgi:large subunit ribosomal protein L17